MADSTYGVMEVRQKSALRQDTKHQKIVVRTHLEEVEGIIKRLIPSHMSNPLSVHASHENVRLLNMVLGEYPMLITGKDRWYDLLMESESDKHMQYAVSRLAPVTPDPKHFTGVLMPFQKYGLDFLLKTQGNALVADEMGLGKTVQTLAFVAQRPQSVPAVVVAPLVTLENWKREIQRFLRLGAGAEKNAYAAPRVEIIRSGSAGALGEADFYIINYELVHKRIRDIVAAGPKLVVFDEIQNLRRANTYKIHACTELANHRSVAHRIGLSGTPIYNNGAEMYEIAEVVRPGIFGSKEQFKEKFYEVDDAYGAVDFKQEELSRFLKRNLLIRRKKMDVLEDLPEKSRVQQTIPIDSGMYEEKIKKMYIKIEEAKRRLGVAVGGADKKRRLAEFNSLLLEMRIEERQLAGLAKAPYVVEYIKGLLEDYEDEKFVVFCHHRRVHKILGDGLWKYRPLQIIGGQTDAARQYAIDEFQANPYSRVIICGLRAGNVGINLTEASYVIFAELDWSPAVHSQAEDRLHRIGQKSRVFAHYIIGAGTFDGYLADVLTAKGDVIRRVLGDKAEATNNKKALELLEERFGPGSRLMGEEGPGAGAHAGRGRKGR